MSERVAGLCIALGMAFTLALGVCLFVPDPVSPDYTVTVDVDKSEKVEQAVSNVMHEVVRRDFVPAYLDIRRTFNGGFTVRCRGIERGNLLRLD